LNEKLSLQTSLERIGEIIKDKQKELLETCEEMDRKIESTKAKLESSRSEVESGTSRSVVKELMNLPEFAEELSLSSVDLSEADGIGKELAEARVNRLRAERHLELFRLRNGSSNARYVSYDGPGEGVEWVTPEDKTELVIQEEWKRFKSVQMKYEKVIKPMTVVQKMPSGAVQLSELMRLVEEMELMPDPGSVFQAFLDKAFRLSWDNSMRK
jgi:hypothetical protein